MTPSTITFIAVLIAGGTATSDAAQPEPLTAARNEHGDTSPGGRVQLSEATFDAGEVQAGTIVRHAYTFTNTGTAALILIDAVSTCDCARIEARSARVEPGKEGFVLVQFDSTGFAGETTQHVAVATNDPQQPQVVLTLKATILSPVELSPSTALFAPKADARTGETKVIRIINHTEQPLVLDPPVSTKTAVFAELRTVLPGKEYELRISAVPPFADGTVRDTIKIRTNLSQMPVLDIRVAVVVRPP